MDIIILGLLLLKNRTIYEIRKAIETVFTSMTSNSMGSIQAAVKRLLDHEMISFDAFIEDKSGNKVYKKVYRITEIGKSYFLSEIQTPMKYKEKNMELIKFFYMGFAPHAKRVELINTYITELQNEKKRLEQIQKTTQGTHIEDYLSDTDIKKIAGTDTSKDLLPMLQDIAQFQYATLNLSIEKIDFEIQWFEQFRNQYRVSEVE